MLLATIANTLHDGGGTIWRAEKVFSVLNDRKFRLRVDNFTHLLFLVVTFGSFNPIYHLPIKLTGPYLALQQLPRLIWLSPSGIIMESVI